MAVIDTTARLTLKSQPRSGPISQTRSGRIRYFDGNAKFLAKWRKAVPAQDRHPIRRDAIEFAENAFRRWEMYRHRDIYVDRAEAIAEYVVDNPHVEISNLVLLDYVDKNYPHAGTVGVCHFRRSWCNNLILDYLSIHPLAAKPLEDGEITLKGIGSALAYFVVQVAIHLNCDAIWAEATQNSCGFYQRVFDLRQVRDLVFVKRKKYLEFCADFCDAR